MFRRDGKSFSHGIFDIIDDLFAGEAADSRIHQDVKTIDRGNLFIVFQLIQSQTQAGSASAKALNNYPEHFARVFLEDFFQDFLRRIGDVNHLCSFVVEC